MSKRLAVVTGTSRGIGRAIAEGLSSRGLRVLTTSRDADLGAKTARELGLPFFPLDVASPASVEALAEHLAQTEGGLDVLVNNAGVALDGFDAGVARRTLDVNFVGAMRTTDRLLPLLGDGARVVMVSSGMGSLDGVSAALRERFTATSLTRDELTALADRFVAEVAARTHERTGFPSNAYCVSKIAMNAYTRILARELASDPRRILVNAACPGWVRTDMGGASAPRSPREGARTPVWLATLPDGGPSGGFFRDERAIDW
ncbi:MAG: SDR family NAD(P)-dependent oxidoreductase [Myxococcales bacterium]|nr:SDR family NAD(P)-dependent oxidoreductase [Myxococcales bacterium]